MSRFAGLTQPCQNQGLYEPRRKTLFKKGDSGPKSDALWSSQRKKIANSLLSDLFGADLKETLSYDSACMHACMHIYIYIYASPKKIEKLETSKLK